MSDCDDYEASRLARILQDFEQGLEGRSQESLSDTELRELEQAKRALVRLERIAASSESEESTPAMPTPAMRHTFEADTWANTFPSDATGDLWGKGTETREPRRLGRFTIERVLGHGGFGVVLLAHDPKLDQSVALKIPRSEWLLSDEGRQRLLREAKAATLLSHPNIVPIYESASIGVVPYISFGYCSGPTLCDFIDGNRSRLNPRLAARIIAVLAGALQHAHSRGIVHRDLKPANVILAQPIAANDSDDKILDALRVADFGLVSARAGDADLTRPGAPLGTPAYMSPEQARGETEIGPASDIFSLGVTLYEMLTCKSPFKRPTDLATLRAVELAEPPSAWATGKGISKDLSAIVQKCMQKRIKDRYGTAQELENDLRRFLNNEPVQARSVGKAARLARWCSRNRMIATCLLVAFTSLTLGVFLSIGYARKARASELAALESARHADSRYSEALSLSGLFHTTYDSFREILQKDLQGNDDKARQLKQKLLGTTKEHYKLVVAQRPTDRELLREYVNMLRPMAYQLQLLGDQQTSAEIWVEASAILESEFPEDVHAWAAIMGKLVEDYTSLQRAEDAVATANLILERLLQSASNSEGDREVGTQLVHAMTGAALALNGMGKYAEAHAILQNAETLVCDLEHCEIQNWPTNKTWARLIRTECETIGHLELYSELRFLAPLGIAQYEALRKDAKYIDLALDSIPTFYDSLAVVFAQEQKFDDAITQFENGLAIREKLIERHPEMGWLYLNACITHQRIAQVLNQSGDHPQAINVAEKQVARLLLLSERFVELQPAINRQLVDAYWILSSALFGDDQNSRAIEAASRGIELIEESSTDGTISLAFEGRLGTLYSIQAFASNKMQVKRRANEQAIIHLQNALHRGGSSLFQIDLDSALRLRSKLEIPPSGRTLHGAEQLSPSSE